MTTDSHSDASRAVRPQPDTSQLSADVARMRELQRQAAALLRETPAEDV